jgi:hypothetical protein
VSTSMRPELHIDVSDDGTLDTLHEPLAREFPFRETPVACRCILGLHHRSRTVAAVDGAPSEQLVNGEQTSPRKARLLLKCLDGLSRERPKSRVHRTRDERQRSRRSSHRRQQVELSSSRSIARTLVRPSRNCQSQAARRQGQGPKAAHTRGRSEAKSLARCRAQREHRMRDGRWPAASSRLLSQRLIHMVTKRAPRGDHLFGMIALCNAAGMVRSWRPGCRAHNRTDFPGNP